MKMLSAISMGFFLQNKPTFPIVLIIVAAAALSQVILWFYIGRTAWKDLTKSMNNSKMCKK